MNVRHILIGTTYQDPTNPYSRPAPLAQKAEQEAQQAKIEKLVEEIATRNKINLPAPEEIKVKAPEMPAVDPMMQDLPPGMDGETPGQDKSKTPDKSKDKTPSKK